MINLMDGKEIARLYPQWSYWTWLDMAKRGIAPHIRVGKRVFFNPESIDQWLKELETGGSQPKEEAAEFGKLRQIRT